MMRKKTYLLLFFLPLLFPILVAYTTEYDVHSDEANHLDAFYYYEDHWLPAKAGSPGIYYSLYGVSRIMTGELVYPLYGKIGRLLRPIFPPETRSYSDLLLPTINKFAFPSTLPFSGPTGGVDLVYYQQRMDFLQRQTGAPNVRLYRTLNLLLLGFTLWAASRLRFDWPPREMFLALLTLPSVVYIYGYANSDAFALSVSVLTVLYVFHIHAAGGLTRRRALGFGLLLGLIWASKMNFWLTGFYALGMLILLEGNAQSWKASLQRLLPFLGLAGLLSLLPMLPYRVILPRLVGNDAAAIRHAQELYARFGMKPSNPLMPRLALGQKGFTWRDLLLEMGWLQTSFRQMYASFNYTTLTVARPVVLTAGLLYSAAALLTAVILLRQGQTRHKMVYIWSALVFLLNLGASLHHSLTSDYTPLGRYLFPSLVPLAFITFGGLAFTTEARTQRTYRLALALLALLHLIAWFTLRPA